VLVSEHLERGMGASTLHKFPVLYTLLCSPVILQW